MNALPFPFLTPGAGDFTALRTDIAGDIAKTRQPDQDLPIPIAAGQTAPKTIPISTGAKSAVDPITMLGIAQAASSIASKTGALPDKPTTATSGAQGHSGDINQGPVTFGDFIVNGNKNGSLSTLLFYAGAAALLIVVIKNLRSSGKK